MAPRAIIPKNLANFVDFPKKEDLSGKEYQVLVLAYWKAYRYEKKKANRANYVEMKKQERFLNNQLQWTSTF